HGEKCPHWNNVPQGRHRQHPCRLGHPRGERAAPPPGPAMTAGASAGTPPIIAPDSEHFLVTLRSCSLGASAWADIRRALTNHHQITTLGWQDVATRYRRSVIGAFWLTINKAVLIAAIGLVFGTLFGQPMEKFLPHLAVGLIFWGFITASIDAGCAAFINKKGIILQVNLPLY